MLKQLEPTIVEVGEMKFYITPFPALKAANLTGELTSTLAPLLGVMAPFISEEGGLDNVDVSQIGNAMASCTAINGDQIEKLATKLLLGGQVVIEMEDDETGEISGEKLTRDLLDEIFCGEVQDLFVLCFHVIRLNFNGFFKKLGVQSGAKSITEKIPRARL